MSSRKRRDRLTWLSEPVTVFGTLVSIIIGVVFYVRTDLRAALGVIAGLQSTLLVLQVQLLLSQERNYEDKTRYASLVESIERVPWLSSPLTAIVAAANNVENRHRSKTTALLGNEILRDCVSGLDDLERGHYTEDTFDTELLARVTAGTQHVVRAIACQPIGPEWPWWSSPQGRLYWASNVALLSRGIRVERVFIFHDWNDAVASIVSEQRLAGVDVHCVKANELTADLRRNLIIWDEDCGWEVTTNAAGVSIGSYFTVNDYDLQRIVSRYNQILVTAKRVDT